MNTKIKVGVVGAAGYTGGELIRLLLQHPAVEIDFVLSRIFDGKPITAVHSDLIGETNLSFSNIYTNTVVVLFLCLPHNESSTWLKNNTISNEVKVIDLGNDFRINSQFQNENFIYGLQEVNKIDIAKSNYVANPGCFATAIQLALLPLANEQLLKNVYTTGITGSTGAGQQLQLTSHFSWRANNISAYKTLSHQHVPEIRKTLEQLNNSAINLAFVPWRGDFTRGIFTSSTIETDLDLDTIKKKYCNFYENNPFVFVSENTIDLKQVVNTNKCMIHIEKNETHIVIHSAIDNLIKGASGQAIQNMNIMFGLPETTGLKLKASAF
ncbi:N-acetyl-gamma-glutamyl-phosphate reductase [Flavobacterium chuncheonense]|uniref:N-acetyl-gamma-glutamyl-phosphate reductase n=1 Tax=Flavobacterium chuncheonense TaxID=2026653 RepID=A0ABW5YP64_9FLAO